VYALGKQVLIKNDGRKHFYNDGKFG